MNATRQQIRKWESETKTHCPDCGGSGTLLYFDHLEDEYVYGNCETCSSCGWVPESWLDSGVPEKTNKFWTDEF